MDILTFTDLCRIANTVLEIPNLAPRQVNVGSTLNDIASEGTHAAGLPVVLDLPDSLAFRVSHRGGGDHGGEIVTLCGTSSDATVYARRCSTDPSACRRIAGNDTPARGQLEVPAGDQMRPPVAEMRNQIWHEVDLLPTLAGSEAGQAAA